MPPTCMVTVYASGSLPDPELTLPSSTWPEKPNAVEADSRLDLYGGRVVLFFSGARFVPFLPEPHAQFPYYPLWYFLMYRSRVHYNVIFPEYLPEPPEIVRVNEVVFSLRRRVKVMSEDNRSWHYDTTPNPVAVSVDEFEALLRCCTFELYLALAYYVIGCENVRYFLVEFYKALEAIENAFGGERQAIDALRPHGLAAASFKQLKRDANDTRRALDIGRHAPAGQDIRVIDVARLLEEPRSHEVFLRAVSAVRNAIDAYFEWLREARRP